MEAWNPFPPARHNIRISFNGEEDSIQETERIQELQATTPSGDSVVYSHPYRRYTHWWDLAWSSQTRNLPSPIVRNCVWWLPCRNQRNWFIFISLFISLFLLPILFAIVATRVSFSFGFAGTKVKYKPGIIMGGRQHRPHDCGVSRSIGYFLEPLILLGLFAKKPLTITLKGINLFSPFIYLFLLIRPFILCSNSHTLSHLSG